MTSTTPFTLNHPIQWTQASASSCFPAPIRHTKDLSIDKLFEDLHPRWLSGGVNIEQAIRDACRNHTPDIDLQWAKDSLRGRQTKNIWPGYTQEEHTSTFCTTWLKGLNEPRRLQRYRYRCVSISQTILPPVCVFIY